MSKESKARLAAKHKAYWAINNPYDIKSLKRCSLCKQFLSRNCFTKQTNVKDGLNPSCSICKNNRARNNNRLNPARKILLHAKERARKKGLICTISCSDIVIPTICPILKIPLMVADKVLNDNSPTLDRINNELGYTPDNIQIISYRANRIKNNATFAELLLIVEHQRQLQVLK